MPPKPTAIFRRPAPEQAELLRRRAELAALRRTLAAQEAALARLRSQLHSFEARYIRQVGVLYVQLDEWADRIAELNNPDPASTAGAPGLASETLTSKTPTAATESDPPAPALDLKALFREVAKRIHPDFALNARDERHRTRLMAQANEAFLRADAGLLHRMLHGHDLPLAAPDPVAELAHTLAQISHVQNDLLALDAELNTLTLSDMADLRHRTTLAATEGRDLLAELAAQVKGRIGLAMRRFELDQGRIRRKEAAFNPTPMLSAETPTPPPPIKHRNFRTPRP
jgi:hypothetical protein